MFIKTEGSHIYKVGFTDAVNKESEYKFYMAKDRNVIVGNDDEFDDVTAADESKFLISQSLFRLHSARETSAFFDNKGNQMDIDELRYIGEGPDSVFNYSIKLSSPAQSISLLFRVRHFEEHPPVVECEMGTFKTHIDDSFRVVISSPTPIDQLLQCLVSFDQARYFRGSNPQEPLRIKLDYKP
jgi:hypothetical protein